MILKTIIDRLNQRVEVSNIFDRIYGLCELTGDKGWIYYIGDGQALPVTDYDAKVGTLFWAKRGKVNISKVENLRVSGCKQMYSTKFNLSAYAVVRKNNLPCDSEDAGDWVASRVFKLVSGRDYGFKDIIDVVSYEVIPNGYTVGDKTLPPNFEFATVVIDIEVEIVSGSEDTCYDICNTGDLPLPPDFLPCNPCLTEVAVDGITIIGNGTPADPLIAIGGGGGGGALIALPFTTDHLSATGNAYAIGNIVWYNGNVYRCIAANDSILPTNTSYWVNLGAGFPTVQQPSDWNATSGNNQILNKPIISAQSLQDVTDIGNTTTNDIQLINDAEVIFGSGGGVLLDNASRLREGTIDAGLGGSKGIAQICGVGYELKWEAGRLYVMNGNGNGIRWSLYNFTTTPTVNDDITKGYAIGSRWTLDDGSEYLCSDATIGAAVWAVVSVGGVTSVTGTAPIASSGGTTPDISITQADSTTDGYLSSTDWNTFDGKFDVPTGTNADYLDGTGTPTLFPTLTNGTVTSVAATVPNPTNAAFSVAVPNPNTTPSIDITANGVVSQYVRGDGSLANFPLGGGGGASVNYYLNGSISQGTIGGNAYFQMSRTPILGAGTNFQRTNAQGNGYIAQFITDAGDPSLLAIPSGNWNFETYFSASSGGGNPSFYIELYKYDGATFTLISTGSTNPEPITGGTVVDLYVSALAVPSTVLLATDRLAVRIFVTTSGRTITLHTEDNNLCQVITTFTTGLNALNGLTAQVQNFATGTTGTDFGISSASSTHTFNLPTASGTNRGALSSGDWTTFNGKFNTPSGTTSQYVRGDGSLATFPTLPLVYKSAADTAGYQSTANTAVYTQLIPANTFAAGDIIRVSYRAKKLLTNGATTTRIYINSTANLSGSPIQVGILSGVAGSRFLQMERHLVIKNSTNASEVAISSSTLNSDTVNTGNFDTLVINWTNALYFVFAFQNASALDTNFGSMYLIEKL